MFYFEQLFRTALTGIDSANLMPTVIQVGWSILLLSLLYSVYEGFARGGDVRTLGIGSVKYVALGAVFANYAWAFRQVNDMFNTLANFIATTTSGGQDVFDAWTRQLAAYWQANGISSLWNLIPNLVPGLISVVVLLLAFVVWPVAYTLFSLFYTLYGSVLYVVGPLVVALLPMIGVGPLARTYLVNLLIFHSWGVIYAIFGALLSAVNLNSVSAVLNAGSVLDSFVGSSQMMLLALTSLLFAISIALIPFLARRIVQGDLGSTMFAMIGTAVAAGQAAAAAYLGLSGGFAKSAHSGTEAVPAPSGSAGGGSSGGGAAAPAIASSQPPRPLSDSGGAGPAAAQQSSSAAPMAPVGSGSGASYGQEDSAPAASTPSRAGLPGRFHGFSYVHALSWAAGSAIGAGVRWGRNLSRQER